MLKASSSSSYTTTTANNQRQCLCRIWHTMELQFLHAQWKWKERTKRRTANKKWIWRIQRIGNAEENKNFMRIVKRSLSLLLFRTTFDVLYSLFSLSLSRMLTLLLVSSLGIDTLSCLPRLQLLCLQKTYSVCVDARTRWGSRLSSHLMTYTILWLQYYFIVFIRHRPIYM